MSGIPPEVTALLALRSRSRCERCGIVSAPGGFSRHHRRPRGMGGTRRPDVHSPANLLMLCGSGTTGCHGWVEANRFLAYRDGLLVRQGHSPETIPVRLRDGWWLLLPSGAREPVDAPRDAPSDLCGQTSPPVPFDRVRTRT